MNTIDINQMQQELFNLPASAVDASGCLLRDFYFFKVGQDVQGIKDWIQATKQGDKTDYSKHAIEGLKI